MQDRRNLSTHPLIGLNNQRPLMLELINLLLELPSLYRKAKPHVPGKAGCDDDEKQHHREHRDERHRNAREGTLARDRVVADIPHQHLPGCGQCAAPHQRGHIASTGWDK